MMTDAFRAARQLREAAQNSGIRYTPTELYIGPRARFVVLDTGTRLETQDDNGDWNIAVTWIDGVVFTVTGGVVGVTDASEPTAGNVGETVESLVAVADGVSLTTATAANVTSISLTAGDWDVTANANISETGGTGTASIAGISLTTATLPTDGSECYSGLQTTTLTDINTITLPRKRINVNATTTVYLVAQHTFSVGTAKAFGGLTARRVR